MQTNQTLIDTGQAVIYNSAFTDGPVEIVILGAGPKYKSIQVNTNNLAFREHADLVTALGSSLLRFGADRRLVKELRGIYDAAGPQHLAGNKWESFYAECAEVISIMIN